MLIRAEVFHALVEDGICDPGVWFRDGEASEDLTFCEKAGDAGFPVYVDLQARMGHCTTSVVWPGVTADDQWCIGTQISQDFMAQFPIATAEQLAHEDAVKAAPTNGGLDEAERLGELG